MRRWVIEYAAACCCAVVGLIDRATPLVLLGGFFSSLISESASAIQHTIGLRVSLGSGNGLGITVSSKESKTQEC
jgi:hypothetical protein